MQDIPASKGNAGLFITFEGGEGAGKTSLIASLATYLEGNGHTVTSTREPGGTKAGEDIRQLVVTGDEHRWDATSETALFLTARRSHVHQLIYPALAEGHIILCDRFSDSTLVYQGIAKKLGVPYVKKLSDLIIGECQPDITFVIDVAPEIGLARTHGRLGSETRFESHSIDFHRAIRQGFLDLAVAEPSRMRVIDGAQNAQAVFEAVKHHISKLL